MRQQNATRFKGWWLLGALLVVSLLAVALPAAAAPADICAWIGNSNSDWHNPANWDCGHKPASGDQVTVGVAANSPVISFAAVADTVTIASGGALRIIAELTANAVTVRGTLDCDWDACVDTATFALDTGSTLVLGGALGVEGAIVATSPSYDPAANYVFDGGVSAFSGFDLVEAKDLTISNGTYLFLDGPITVNGVLTIEGGVFPDVSTLDVDLYAVTMGSGSSVVNHGRLAISRSVSNATVSFGLGGTAVYPGVDITTADDMGVVDVEVYGIQTCGIDGDLDEAVQRCYWITPSAAQTADVTLYFSPGELGPNNSPVAWHWPLPSGGWSQLETSTYHNGGPSNPHWVSVPIPGSVPGAPGFTGGQTSKFTLKDAPAPTAISLADFTASPAGRPSAVLVLLGALIALTGTVFLRSRKPRKR